MAFTTRSFSIRALSTPTPSPSPVPPNHKHKSHPRNHFRKQLHPHLQSNNPKPTNPNTHSTSISPNLPPTTNPRISKSKYEETSSIETLTLVQTPINLSMSISPGYVYESDREGIYSSGRSSFSAQSSGGVSTDSGSGSQKRGGGFGGGKGEWKNWRWGVRYLGRKGSGRAGL